MPYEKLISTIRIRSSRRGSLSLVEETESDRARVLFSAPFRRLQQKAQVFPLEDNAAVRSRLTHSYEVSQNGRFIAQLVLRDSEFVQRNGLGDKKEAFVTIAETACLLHDIGNPPFGHFGEAAIRSWFGENYEQIAAASLSHSPKAFASDAFDDFARFDGNAQGLRIMTKLQFNLDEYSYNLTASQIASYLKYLPQAKNVDKDKPFSKKPGYFSTEADVVDWVRETMGFRAPQRHPLVYIMEAADDISYSLSDIEDGLEKGLFDEDRLKRDLSGIMRKLKVPEGEVTDFESTGFFLYKTRLTRRLCEAAAQTYIKIHEDVLSGKAKPLLEYEPNLSAILKSITKFAIKFVYSSREAEDIELAGYNVVRGLLESFRPLMELTSEEFKALSEGERKHKEKSFDLEQRLFRLLPDKHVKAYFAAIANQSDDVEFEWVNRVHIVLDYITGMTDHFSLEVFQRLKGIRV